MRRHRSEQVSIQSVAVEPPATLALGRPADSSEAGCRGAAVDMKLRQASKIREIGHTLVDVGFPTLDMQARALGLSRSTTWTILKASHKSSGLSAAIITRMLEQPGLPEGVRLKIFEYISEKAAGLYGDSEARLRKFTTRLSDVQRRKGNGNNMRYSLRVVLGRDQRD